MSKNYIFFPKGKPGKTLEEDITRRSLNSIYDARSHATKLLKNHSKRYDRIVIGEVIQIDTIHRPFTLGENSD